MAFAPAAGSIAQAWPCGIRRHHRAARARQRRPQFPGGQNNSGIEAGRPSPPTLRPPVARCWPPGRKPGMDEHADTIAGQDLRMRYVELRRHTDNDSDRLTPRGATDAEAIGRDQLHPPYACPAGSEGLVSFFTVPRRRPGGPVLFHHIGDVAGCAQAARRVVGRMARPGAAAGVAWDLRLYLGCPQAGLMMGTDPGSPLLSRHGGTTTCPTSTSTAKTGCRRGSGLAGTCVHPAGTAPVPHGIWVSRAREVPRCRSGRSQS